MVCPEDTAVFNCSLDDTTVIEWRISSTCGSGDVRRSFSRNHHVGYTTDVTLCSTSLMFRVTSLTSSSISVFLTIHTPLLLNGTRITCGRQTVTLAILSGENRIDRHYLHNILSLWKTIKHELFVGYRLHSRALLLVKPIHFSNCQ